MNRRGSSTITGEIISFEPISRKNSRVSRNSRHGEFKFPTVEENVSSDKGPKFGKRHIEVLLFFFSGVINISMRIHLSLTIVAMTDPKANPHAGIVTFDWKNKNIILSSFFWGYIWPQIFAGWVMTRYGHKYFIICSTAAVSIISLLTPWLAIQFGSTAVIIARVLQGASQAFLVPSTSCFMSRWVPYSERSRSAAFIMAGATVACVLGMMIAGYLSASSYGWPMTFYFFGFSGIIWSVAYFLFGSNSPADHPHITQAERNFIEETAAQLPSKSNETPWVKIVTSVPFMSLTVACSFASLTIWILLSQVPSYLSKILQFNINSNGNLNAFLYSVQWVISIIISGLTDFIVNKKYLSLTAARKINSCIGLLTPAVALVGLVQCTKEQSVLSVVLLTIALAAWGANLAGLFINNLDIAPNYAGVLHGFINAFSGVSAAVAPLLVQYMVPDEYNADQWKKVFYLASTFCLMATILFVIFGTAKKQSWNENPEDEDTAEAESLSTQKA